jgi:predicted Zn-ribbon and HTH transcriptional regulator
MIDITICTDCGNEFQEEQLGARCPKCGSIRTAALDVLEPLLEMQHGKDWRNVCFPKIETPIIS